LPNQVHQRHVAADVLGDQRGDVVERRNGPAGDFLCAIQPAKSLHACFGILAKLDPGGLVARRSHKSQHAQVLAVPLMKQLAHVVPEIGADHQAAGRLGRTGHRDGRGLEPPLGIVKTQNVDGVVLVAFDVAEVGIVGVPVHLGRPVAVDHAPIVAGDGVPQSPSHRSLRPVAPGPRHGVAHALEEERQVLLRRHCVAVVFVVVGALEHHRRRVRVGRGER